MKTAQRKKLPEIFCHTAPYAPSRSTAKTATPPKKRIACAPMPYALNSPPAIQVSAAASEKKSVCQSIFPADQKMRRRIPTAQPQEKRTSALSRLSYSIRAMRSSAIIMKIQETISGHPRSGAV